MFGHGRLAKRPEARANLFGQELWLFPGGEVVALLDLVEVDEVGVGPLGPGPGGLVELVREDADGRRDGDALDVEEAELVLPVETRSRDPRVRQPVQRDVVEDLVAREVADGLSVDEG